ncbi:MAG: protocatechuate 3,4-dioxygenase subunit beta [Paracoccaceae bacterium]
MADRATSGHRPYLPHDPARQPPPLTPAYKTTVSRAPILPPVALEASLTELTGPRFGPSDLGPLDHDLLRNFGTGAEPIGERIVLHGRVIDDRGRGLPGALVEIWQANAGGRYRHPKDGYRAPLDPNFGGAGRCLTDETGTYAFRTVKPGAYPWPNGLNSWRPAHIHVSVFGVGLGERLITQMYFEGDPLIPLCPILGTIPDQAARESLVAPLDMAAAAPFDALAYRFDIVLRGRRMTWFEDV